MNKFFTISAITLLASCAHVQNTADHFQAGKGVNEFCNLPRNDAQTSIEKILKRYGTRNQMDVAAFPNKYAAGESDETHTALYGNGKLVVCSVPHMGRNYVLRVILTEEFWLNFLSRYIGKSHQKLTEYFGDSDSVIENNAVYYCAIEADEYITSYMVKNRVAALEIKGWID